MAVDSIGSPLAPVAPERPTVAERAKEDAKAEAKQEPPPPPPPPAESGRGQSVDVSA